MNNIMKKTASLLIVATLVISGICYNPANVKAESVTLLMKEDVVTAGTDIAHEFVTEDSGEMYVILWLPEIIDGSIVFYENGEQVSASGLEDAPWISAEKLELAELEELGLSELGLKELGGYICVSMFNDIIPAQWNVIMNFNANTEYILLATQKKEVQKAFLSQNAITLAKGFSEKLSVSGTTGKIIWASSNNKIATVNSAGRVKAKKAGSAKITATTEDGQVLTCVVSVQKNEYNVRRAYASEIPYGECTIQVYKMSYDSKGNLVLKASLLNNKDAKAVGINKLTIKVKDVYGKTIGTLKVKEKNISAEAGSNSKPIKFVIKKSALKNKKADLRTAKYEILGGEGKFVHTRY